MPLFVNPVLRIFHCGNGPDTSQGRSTLKVSGLILTPFPPTTVAGSKQKLPPSLSCPLFIDPFSPIGTSAQSPTTISLFDGESSSYRIKPWKILAKLLP